MVCTTRSAENGTLSIGYTVTIRAAYPNRVGMLGKITSTIGEVGGDISAVDIVESRRGAVNARMSTPTGPTSLKSAMNASFSC